jgi:hypothetical protein
LREKKSEGLLGFARLRDDLDPKGFFETLRVSQKSILPVPVALKPNIIFGY